MALELEFVRNEKTLVYDDICNVINNGEIVHTFKCNTQPGTTREGVATLAPGIYLYKPGIHGLSKPPSRRYPAFVQADSVYVFRSGSGNHKYLVEYSINIHHGGNSSVSSLGCLTFPPDIWDEFHSLVLNILDRNDQHQFRIRIRVPNETPQLIRAESPKYSYFLHNKEFKPYTIQGGRAIVKVRAFIALLLKVEPDSLDFTWADDDLYYNNKKIETIDVRGQEGVTYGTLSSCVYACGLNLFVDDSKLKVTIPI